MNRLLYYAIRLSVYPLAFALTVLTTRPGIWILRKLMASILDHLVPAQQAEISTDEELGIRAFETYVVPAAQAIWEQVQTQNARDHLIHCKTFELINSFPTEDRGDLLDRLLSTVLDGEVRLVDSIFNGYCNLINATGDMLTKLK